MDPSEKFILGLLELAVAFLLIVQLAHGIALTYLRRALQQHQRQDRQNKLAILRMLRSLRDPAADPSVDDPSDEAAFEPEE